MKPEKFVANYYNNPSLNEPGQSGAGLIWYMTKDHLSPPLSNVDDTVYDPNLWIEATRDRVLSLANKLQISNEQIVLDFGSGIGGPGRDIMNSFGCEVIAINLSSKQIYSMQYLSKAADSNYMTAIQTDMQVLPIKDMSIDNIVSINAIYHVPNSEKVFNEAFRTLKPGGRFGIDDWFITEKCSNEELQKLRNNWSSPLGFHVINSFITEAQKAGFILEDVVDYTEEGGQFLSPTRFGDVYDAKLSSKLVNAFEKLYKDTYTEYEQNHAILAVKQLKTDILFMGHLYRNGSACYKQLVFKKAG